MIKEPFALKNEHWLDDPVEDLVMELEPDQILRGGLRGAVDLGHPAVG